MRLEWRMPVFTMYENLVAHRLEALLHLQNVLVLGDVVLGVAELRLELELVVLDLLRQLLDLLRVTLRALALGRLLVRFRVARDLAGLDLQLLHARDHLDHVRVLVLLATGEPLLLQGRLLRHDLHLELLELVTLRRRDPRALRLLLLLLLLILGDRRRRHVGGLVHDLKHNLLLLLDLRLALPLLLERLLSRDLAFRAFLLSLPVSCSLPVSSTLIFALVSSMIFCAMTVSIGMIGCLGWKPECREFAGALSQ